MAKAVVKKTKLSFGKRKTGKAVKHPNKKANTKKYNRQGR